MFQEIHEITSTIRVLPKYEIPYGLHRTTQILGTIIMISCYITIALNTMLHSKCSP